MSTFANLKRSSGSFDQLIQESQKIVNPSNNSKGDDDRFWKPTVDKAGNGYAVLRFLPAPEGEDLPWARLYTHGFQGPGGWYIENSLTTLNQKDPVSEYNSYLWNSVGSEEAKDQVRKQKRRLSYVANVYVVKDSGNPSNEGQVKLYKFGKKIFDKINEAMNPQFEDEDALNPFDLWQGANFLLKIRQVEGYRNYDRSSFDVPSALLEDDEKLELVWRSESSLKEFTDPSQFKSFDELKAKLDKVLGLDDNEPRSPLKADELETVAEPVVEQTTAAAETATAEPSWTANDDDDSLSFFENLAKD